MKNIYCIQGPSGVGKSTVTEYLCKVYGYSAVCSNTDRPPRYPGEEGHVFLTPEEFDRLPPLVAYTEYCGHRYGVPAEDIDKNDIYVIDPPGIVELKQKYHGKKGIVVIELTASIEELRSRMKKRGDSEEKIQERLANDYSWFSRRIHGIKPDFTVHSDDIDATAKFIREVIRFKEENSPDIKIFQINPEYDFDKVKFFGTSELKRKYGQGRPICINASTYDEVWSGDVEYETLEDLFMIFNSDNRPDAQYYHALSVSDVIEIAHSGNPELNGKWFVDTFGFKRLKDDVYIPIDCD